MSTFSTVTSSLLLLSALPNSPGELLDLLTRLLTEYGYLVVFIGAALDFILPSSGDLTMLAGGLFANSTGGIFLPTVMLVGALGALVCDNTMYWAGRLGGQPFVNRLFRNPLISRFLDRSHLERVENWFYQHGGKTVIFGRFVPGLRAAMPLSAGLSKMAFPRFILFDLAAIAAWSPLMATIGYLFGQYWEQLVTAIQAYGRLVLILLALIAVGLFVYRTWLQPRRTNSRKDSPE